MDTTKDIDIVNAEGKAIYEEVLLLEFKATVQAAGYPHSLAQLCEDAVEYLRDSTKSNTGCKTSWTCITLGTAAAKGAMREGYNFSNSVAEAALDTFTVVFWEGNKYPFSYLNFSDGSFQQARALWLTFLAQYFEDEGL